MKAMLATRGILQTHYSIFIVYDFMRCIKFIGKSLIGNIRNLSVLGFYSFVLHIVTQIMIQSQIIYMSDSAR